MIFDPITVYMQYFRAPILIAYPFFQLYFINGIMIGAVKG
jgi:ABC-type glycerol-3-phosphate transport system permease component